MADWCFQLRIKKIIFRLMSTDIHKNVSRTHVHGCQIHHFTDMIRASLRRHVFAGKEKIIFNHINTIMLLYICTEVLSVDHSFCLSPGHRSHTAARHPSLKGVIKVRLAAACSGSLFWPFRLFSWAATATTWSQVGTTAWWRCGRPATSNGSTSTRAATPASEPWTSHTTRGPSRHLCGCRNALSFSLYIIAFPVLSLMLITIATVEAWWVSPNAEMDHLQLIIYGYIQGLNVVFWRGDTAIISYL